VAEDKGDLVLGAEVGDPVPGEEALDADVDVCAERGKVSRRSCVSSGIEVWQTTWPAWSRTQTARSLDWRPMPQ
jgi:hypothetical protein